MITDPISDMLTRIRNSYLAGKFSLMVPFSKEKAAVAKVLAANKIITLIKVAERTMPKMLQLELNPERQRELQIKRISTPGRRIYARLKNFPKVKGGQGFLIVSTSAGIMDSQTASKLKIGGEIIAEVF